MDSISFTIYNDRKSAKDIDLMQIQVGKKKRNQAIYIALDSFIFLDEVIWDNHREYAKNTKNKIRLDDWKRIETGMQEVIEQLKNASTKDEVYAALKLRKHLMQNSKIDMFAEKEKISTMFQECIDFIQNANKKDGFIIIQKAK